jgi:pectin methylesterase-like acyl-CoA thioesterase
MMCRHRLLLIFALGLISGGTQAQDSRKVVEPLMPPSCAVLSAMPDSATLDDTLRIQQAIDQCAAGYSVRLSPYNEKKRFRSGPLVLRSGVTLVIEEGATLMASTNPQAYDRGAGSCGTIDQSGKGCRPFISLEDGKDSGIMGQGSIDGQGGQLMDGHKESWWQLARRAQREEAHQNVPRLIEVLRSNNFTMYGITLRNAANFHVTLNHVDGYTAWGVRIDTPADARNTDGIDPISSRNITIAHSYIRTGDDNIAIKSGANGPSENISVLHNHFYSGHGMSIGSETISGVRNVLVDDLTMQDATSGLRIKSDISRGGVVENIRYNNVCLRDIRAPIDVNTQYTKNATGSLLPVYRNIQFTHVHSLSPGNIILRGLDAQHPLRASFEDVVVNPASKRDVQHALFGASGTEVLNLSDGAGIDCSSRFTPFPQPSEKITRPQLTAAQAQGYSITEVLKTVGAAGKEVIDPWDPLADPLATGAAFKADYVVDLNATADGTRVFNSVQQAVNRAVIDSASTARKRLFIQIKPGTYKELLYVPASPVPLTLYSEEADAGKTTISAKIDAALSSAEYVARFGAQFEKMAPSILAMHEQIRARPTISTSGAMVVWVRNNGFQVRNITFENAYNKDAGNTRNECGERDCGKDSVYAQMNIVHHQAVALQIEGADRAQFENLRLIGFQDTLFLKSATPGNTVRSFFHRSYVEGDVDYIFGDTTAYFYRTEIRSLGDRTTSYVGAPNTNFRTKYGFVFNDCRFTNDGKKYALDGKFYLARQWFFNQRCTPFGSVPVPGYSCTVGGTSVFESPKGIITKAVLETVGKMVILNSHIGAHIQKGHPWADWNRNGTLPFRPAQYSSNDFWNNLRTAGIDPVAQLGYGEAPAPADIYLGEYNNTHE